MSRAESLRALGASDAVVADADAVLEQRRCYQSSAARRLGWFEACPERRRWFLAHLQHEDGDGPDPGDPPTCADPSVACSHRAAYPQNMHRPDPEPLNQAAPGPPEARGAQARGTNPLESGAPDAL